MTRARRRRPRGPYIQSERRDTYGKYAQLLVEKGGAYYCFCEKTESEEDSGEFDRAADPCRELTAQQVQEKLDAGLPYVIRQRIPRAAPPPSTTPFSATSPWTTARWTTRCC